MVGTGYTQYGHRFRSALHNFNFILSMIYFLFKERMCMLDQTWVCLMYNVLFLYVPCKRYTKWKLIVDVLSVRLSARYKSENTHWILMKRSSIGVYTTGRSVSHSLHEYACSILNPSFCECTYIPSSFWAVFKNLFKNTVKLHPFLCANHCFLYPVIFFQDGENLQIMFS